MRTISSSGPETGPGSPRGGLRIFNHSYADLDLDPAIASQEGYRMVVDNYARSVGLGSVHVWPAGNDFGGETSVQGKRPLDHPQLEAGWPVVVALNKVHTAPPKAYDRHAHAPFSLCIGLAPFR